MSHSTEPCQPSIKMNKMGCGRLGRWEFIMSNFAAIQAHRTLWGFSVGVFFLLAQPLSWHCPLVSVPVSLSFLSSHRLSSVRVASFLFSCFCCFARMFSGSLAASPARLRSCLAFRPLMLLQSRLLSSLLFGRETLFMRVAFCYYSSRRWASFPSRVVSASKLRRGRGPCPFSVSVSV